MGVGNEGAGGNVPPKIREKYFSGNYYVKFGHFSFQNHVKNHVKFRNLVIFFEKYYKNLVILPGKNRVKFGHFVNFSYIFLGQKCPAP